MMGSKRKLSDLEEVHPSRRAQVPGFVHPPPKGPRSLAHRHRGKRSNHMSVNMLKKSIRNKKRRLERVEDLPPTIRVEDERALKAYEEDLAAVEEEKKRQKMIKRYHMVRFFERQKATRAVKKLRKQLLEPISTEEAERINGEIHIAEVDLNYTQFYPLNVPYVGLFARKNPDDGNSATQEENANGAVKKPPIWAEVEKAMAEGTLELLKNGSSSRVTRDIEMQDVLPVRSKPKSKPISARSKARGQASDNAENRGNSNERSKKVSNDAPPRQGMDHMDISDDNSDGGFFDE